MSKKFLLLTFLSLIVSSCGYLSKEANQKQSLSVVKKEIDKEQVGAFNDIVYFNFDQYSINKNEVNVLNSQVEYINDLKSKNVKIKDIVIEGHCDDRGTVEYNLALGQKRALSTKKYLQSNKIENIRIKSYGKSIPINNAQNENAYAENRRTKTNINFTSVNSKSGKVANKKN